MTAVGSGDHAFETGVGADDDSVRRWPGEHGSAGAGGGDDESSMSKQITAPREWPHSTTCRFSAGHVGWWWYQAFRMAATCVATAR